MLLYGAPSCLLCVWFHGGARRRAFICDAPMIKHPWQMHDLLRLNLFNATQRQVVVLRAFKAAAKTAYTSDQLGSVNAQVRDEVLREKKLGVPIGLEVRIGTAVAGVELVFVAVEQLQFWIFVERQGHEIKRSGRQFIVVIEQRYKIALRHSQRVVRCR